MARGALPRLGPPPPFQMRRPRWNSQAPDTTSQRSLRRSAWNARSWRAAPTCSASSRRLRGRPGLAQVRCGPAGALRRAVWLSCRAPAPAFCPALQTDCCGAAADARAAPPRAGSPWRPLRLRPVAASACGKTTGFVTPARRASTASARRAATATTSGAAASTRAWTPAAAAARPATSAASPATPATTAELASTPAAAVLCPRRPRRTACRRPLRPLRKSSKTRCTPGREVQAAACAMRRALV